ncbi:hypothetical protein D9611_014468 [Ephemerocybe angulata]|uniref:Uncharacterized protein n=1 Tax=Ephemerocybe angulata TaxID=980116 RepID=A0A8H5FF26_9AGAR|nr:hypothetical protein D9611_014468 [Tulosesus angulatus]
MPIPADNTTDSPGAQPRVVQSCLPKFFHSHTMRLWCLRWTIGTSLVGLYYSAYLYAVLRKWGHGSELGSTIEDITPLAVVLVVVSSVTLLHHSVYIFAVGRPVMYSKRWTRIVDYVLTLLELLAYLAMATILLIAKFSRQFKFSWYPKRVTFGLAALFALTISLILLLITKSIDLNLSRVHHNVTGASHAAESRQPTSAWWNYPMQVFFGREARRQRLPGEPKWIRYLRAVSVFLIVITLVLYGSYRIILQPVAEMGLTPNREYRAVVLPSTFTVKTSGVWNVILFWQTEPEAQTRLIDASSVIVGWPSEGKACQASEAEDLEAISPGFEVVSFNCTNKLNIEAALGSYVEVYVGLTDDRKKVLRSTEPTQLVPGANLIGFADWFIRQRLRRRSLATLGFELYHTHLVTKITSTYPEPLAPTYTNTTNPLLSTLWLTKAPLGPDFVVLQDFRNESVLNGLSVLGGLSSLFSALLTMWLGTSLIHGKLYSPLGILHTTESTQGKLKHAFMESYPLLREDIARLRDPKRRGLQAFLYEEIVDLEALKFEEDEEEEEAEMEMDDGRNKEAHGREAQDVPRVMASPGVDTGASNDMRAVV